MLGARRATRLGGSKTPLYISYRDIRDIENENPLGTRMDAGFQKVAGGLKPIVRGIKADSSGD